MSNLLEAISQAKIAVRKGFTGIVGPNGSGKSNVIDAMQFVFGRRAKALRQDKIAQLVHYSKQNPNCTSATVTIHFQEIIDQAGPKEFDVVPGSRFTVARQVRRDNASSYYINSKKVKTEDVNRLLKSKGIDLDNNRFLILQFEVQSISQMAPKGEDNNSTGLLEFLEEVIGSNQSQERREELGKKLEEIMEQKQEQQTRTRVAQAAVDKQEPGVKVARDYVAVQMRQTQLKSHLLQIKLYQDKGKCDEYGARVQMLAAELDTMATHKNELHQQLQASEQSRGQCQQELNKVKDALEEVDGRFKGCQTEASLVTGLIKDLEKKQSQKQKKMKEAKEQNQQQKSKLSSQLATLKNTIPMSQKHIEALQEQIASHTQSLKAIEAQCAPEKEALRVQAAAVEEQLAPFNAQLESVTLQKQEATQQLLPFQKEEERARRGVEEAEGGLVGGKEQVVGVGERLKGMEVEYKEKERQVKQAQQHVQHCQQQMQCAVEARRVAVSKRDDVAQSLDGRDSMGRVQKALFEAQAAGVLSGVLGKLGDLATVEAKYDHAVSAGCPELQKILVEDLSCGEACADFLMNDRSLGRGQFLSLQHQAHLEGAMRQSVNVPQGSARLFDLIKCASNRYQPAFYKAMGNVLVCDTFNKANSVAYDKGARQERRKRWKVVTLKGELISESGIQTGGGRNAPRGAMKLGGSAPVAPSEDVGALKQKLQEAEAVVQETGEELQRCKAAVTAAEAALKEAEAGLERLRRDIPKAKEQLKLLQNQVKEWEKELPIRQKKLDACSLTNPRRVELEAKVQQCEQQAQELKDKSKETREELDRLQEAMQNVGGEKKKNLEVSVQNLEKEIQTTTVKLQKDRYNFEEHIPQELERLEQDKGSSSSQQDKIKLEIESNQEKKISIEEKAKEIYQEQQQMEQLVRRQEMEFQQATEAYNELRSKDGEFHSRMQHIKDQKDKAEAAFESEQRIQTKHQEEVKKLSKQYSKLSQEKSINVDAEQEELEPLDETSLQTIDESEVNKELQSLNKELEKNVNLQVLDAFRESVAFRDQRLEELEEINRQKETVRVEYEALRHERLERFMEGFSIITMRLKEVYQMITMGGDAELELMDSLDPFSEGVVFSVRPPKKCWKDITKLSGGEKTLASLSLIFALHCYKPTPLYVMDEIDSSLDIANVAVVGHYLKERTKDAQFIVISLRNTMFELSDRLVGIYKTAGCTRSIAIDHHEEGEALAGDKENQCVDHNVQVSVMS